MDNNILTVIEDRLLELETLPDKESALAALEALDIAKRRIAELKDRVEQAVIKVIQTDGPIEVGERRYYVAANKTTKCTDKAATTQALLEVGGGDLSALVDALASDCFKPGHCRKFLGDRFETLFETKETPDLKTGEVKKRLQVADDRFAR